MVRFVIVNTTFVLMCICLWNPGEKVNNICSALVTTSVGGKTLHKKEDSTLIDLEDEDFGTVFFFFLLLAATLTK